MRGASLNRCPRDRARVSGPIVPSTAAIGSDRSPSMATMGGGNVLGASDACWFVIGIPRLAASLSATCAAKPTIDTASGAAPAPSPLRLLPSVVPSAEPTVPTVAPWQAEERALLTSLQASGALRLRPSRGMERSGVSRLLAISRLTWRWRQGLLPGARCRVSAMAKAPCPLGGPLAFPAPTLAHRTPGGLCGTTALALATLPGRNRP